MNKNTTVLEYIKSEFLKFDAKLVHRYSKMTLKAYGLLDIYIFLLNFEQICKKIEKS